MPLKAYDTFEEFWQDSYVQQEIPAIQKALDCTKLEALYLMIAMQELMLRAGVLPDDPPEEDTPEWLN